MDPSQNDLDAIRRLIADLTNQIYRIERRLRMDVQPAAQTFSETAAPPPPPPETRAAVVEKSAPTYAPVAQLPSRPSTVPESKEDLESRIGSHWLNRIGIAAVL